MARGGLDIGVAGWRAVEVWADAVGDVISAHARATRFSDGTLYVEVESPAWIQELSFLRLEIVEKLNAAVGQKAVSKLRFAMSGGGPRGRRKG